MPLTEDSRNNGLLQLGSPSYNGFSKVSGGKIGDASHKGCAIYHFQNEVFGNKWTLALWVKSSGWGQYNDILICKNNSTSDNDSQFYFSVIGGTQLNIGINGPYSTGNYSYTFNTNQWYHVAATYDGSNYALYINGLQVKTGTCTTAFLSGKYNFGVCCRSTNANGTSQTGVNNVSANDVRVYDEALSPKEIELIARGLVLHYPLNRDGFGQDNLLPGTWSEEVTYTYPASSYSDKYAKSTIIVPSASQYTLSFYAKSTVNGDKIRTHYYSPNTTTTCVSSQGVTKTASDGNMDFTLSTNWEFYWVTYTQTETTAVKHVICPRMGSVKDQPGMSGTGIVSIKCVKIEEGSVATPWTPASTDTLYSALGLSNNIIYDASGYGNNGILNDTTAIYSSDSARYNVSLKNNQEYNSSTYLIKGNCNIPESTNITFAWWMKPTRWGLQQSGLWSTSASGDATDYYTTAANMRDSYFDCCNTSGTCKRVEAASMVTLNEWHHYALTYDGANLKVYKDGVLKTSTAQTGALKAFTSIFLFYSKAGGVNRNTSGYISDFRIYVTTLTESQLLELYNTSASLSNNGTLLSYEFVEGGA